MHYYSFFADAWNGDTYPITRFISETGVQSMPSLETWKQITNFTEDFDFLGALAQYRNRHPSGQQEMMFVQNFDRNSLTDKDLLEHELLLVYQCRQRKIH